MKKKRYIIVGDNNFWYSTTSEITEKQLEKHLKRVAQDIINGGYTDASKPSELFAYEAQRVKSIEIF
jgi:hypothetical protein